MSEDADLGYDPASLAGPLDMNKVLETQNSFQGHGMTIEFDPAYLRHLSRHHGGAPRKRCFKSSEGVEYVIEYFLNFVDYKKDNKLGWYNVGVTWGLIMDRLNDYLIPFAALFAGDFLCFDYEKASRPSVVVWLHEESRQDHPVTEYVAANFDEFLTKLYEPQR
jgi:hypothetical protein